MPELRDSKKKICILHTGGTIGMTLSGSADDAESFLEVLRKYVPKIFDFADIHFEILFNKDSSNIVPSDWVMLARKIHADMNKWDAFVITHGTDTMVFTAAALSFMLQNFPKPVILTGAQRPLQDSKSDAARNLLYAVELAAEGVSREVGLFFDTILIRGNRAKKVSIGSFHAFESPNMRTLAEVGVKTEYGSATLPPAPYVFDPRIETSVSSMVLFPGINSEIFLKMLLQGTKGVLLLAFGPGDIPMGERSVVHLVRSLTEKGIPTVICSQAHQGSVNLELYETGRAAAQAGAVSGRDMTWECALVKMMILLGRGYSLEPFRKLFETNLVGELGE